MFKKKKEGERGREIKGEREKEQHSYTGPSVCRKGRAVKQRTKSSQAGMMCVRECVRERERERVRVCPRHAEMSKLSLSSCRETQTKAASQPLLLLITSHWRAPCEERRQWSRSNSHTHLSTPHRRHQPLLLCKQRSLRSARQKLHHVFGIRKKPTHILQLRRFISLLYPNGLHA